MNKTWICTLHSGRGSPKFAFQSFVRIPQRYYFYRQVHFPSKNCTSWSLSRLIMAPDPVACRTILVVQKTQLTSHEMGSQMYESMVVLILEEWEPHRGGRALHSLSSTILRSHQQQHDRLDLKKKATKPVWLISIEDCSNYHRLLKWWTLKEPLASCLQNWLNHPASTNHVVKKI